MVYTVITFVVFIMPYFTIASAVNEVAVKHHAWHDIKFMNSHLYATQMKPSKCSKDDIEHNCQSDNELILYRIDVNSGEATLVGSIPQESPKFITNTYTRAAKYVSPEFITDDEYESREKTHAAKHVQVVLPDSDDRKVAANIVMYYIAITILCAALCLITTSCLRIPSLNARPRHARMGNVPIQNNNINPPQPKPQHYRLTRAFVHEHNPQCCICLKNLPAKSHVTELACKHIYDPSCIQRWFKQQKKQGLARSCPTCRQLVH
jgi:hypothetical protein